MNKMYKKIIIVTGILLLLVSSVSASDDWWNTSYQYRTPITLTGNTSGSQTNYQLMLNVSYTSNIQSGFDDLRFTDDSGNLQNAWLENKTNDSWANVWVNFTSTPDNGATQTYYVYYGNIEVSNYWNGDATFLQYHGAASAGFLDSLAVTPPDIVYEAKVKATTDTHDQKWGMSDTIDFPAGSESIQIESYTGSNLTYLTARDTAGASSVTKAQALTNATWTRLKMILTSTALHGYTDDNEISTGVTNNIPNTAMGLAMRIITGTGEQQWSFARKYISNPPTPSFGIEEEYTPPIPTSTPIPTPTPIPEITASNYVIQNQTLYITKPCDLQYKITSNSFVYGGLRNINTVICDNNNTVISGWFKVSTDQSYDADYTFLINVNDTSYESKIITIKQEQVDNSIISKVYKRTLLIDGYEIYSYNTTIYIVSILPNPIYFYFNLEDRTIQFGDKQFNNQTLVFNQLNFDDQYNFMNNASSDTVVMKFKAINPEQKSGAELKGLTGLVLNAMSKVPLIGKSLKNIVYYPLFFIQALFNFVFTFLDIIVNDWWYGLMLVEIVCIFAASRNTGYANIMEVYIDTHVKIIKFIYEWIILNMVNLIIQLISLIMELARTVKDMIKWW